MTRLRWRDAKGRGEVFSPATGPKAVTYRGFTIRESFASRQGTGRECRSRQGWIVLKLSDVLVYHWAGGAWASSLTEARKVIDRHLERRAAKQAAQASGKICRGGCGRPVDQRTREAGGEVCFDCATTDEPKPAHVPDRCGYFDNGFDQEHEHRRNCRACLLARIAELTAALAKAVSR